MIEDEATSHAELYEALRDKAFKDVIHFASMNVQSVNLDIELFDISRYMNPMNWSDVLHMLYIFKINDKEFKIESKLKFDALESRDTSYMATSIVDDVHKKVSESIANELISSNDFNQSFYTVHKSLNEYRVS